jgi:segregation and condensation protein B
MESWELKAGIEAILNAVNRPVTVPVLAEALACDAQVIEQLLEEYAAELAAADRGLELRHRAQGFRLEVKPQYAALIGRVIPAWAPKPISKQALETLVIIALKQPVTLAEINAIRTIESAGTVQTLRNRKLIALAARLGPRREKYWRTTPLFLETFHLTSLDQLRQQDGCLEQTFPEVFAAGELPDPEEPPPSFDPVEGEAANRPPATVE